MSTRSVPLGAVALLVALVGLFVVGSGAFDSTSGGDKGRIAALERDVRCPGTGCGDLSVAQSDDPSSIAVRNEIVADVHSGRSDADILATIAARYGNGVLLSPPSGGIDTVLWAAPLVVAGGAVASLGVFAVRRRR